jgi:hypothetical protein
MQVARLTREKQSLLMMWRLVLRLAEENHDMTMHRIVLLLLAAAAVAALPVLAKAQSLTDSEDSSSAVSTTSPAAPDLIYTRPTGKMKLHNYVFDAFGPYPLAGAAFAAGIGQAYNTPPEWKQGARGYGLRIGSWLHDLNTR